MLLFFFHQKVAKISSVNNSIYLKPIRETPCVFTSRPLSVDVKVITVSKRNLSKTRLYVHFRQFRSINNLRLSLSDLLIVACCSLRRGPLFEEPRREGILPLCRAGLPRALQTQRRNCYISRKGKYSSLKFEDGLQRILLEHLQQASFVCDPSDIKFLLRSYFQVK